MTEEEEEKLKKVLRDGGTWYSPAALSVLRQNLKWPKPPKNYPPMDDTYVGKPEILKKAIDYRRI